MNSGVNSVDHDSYREKNDTLSCCHPEFRSRSVSCEIACEVSKETAKINKRKSREYRMRSRLGGRELRSTSFVDFQSLSKCVISSGSDRYRNEMSTAAQTSSITIAIVKKVKMWQTQYSIVRQASFCAVFFWRSLGQNGIVVYAAKSTMSVNRITMSNIIQIR